jgi:hypothetical protein
MYIEAVCYCVRSTPVPEEQLEWAGPRGTQFPHNNGGHRWLADFLRARER